MTVPRTCAPSSPFSLSRRSFGGRLGAPASSPLLSLPGRPGLGRLLAPEGETWPLEVGRGVDLGVDTGSSVRLSARRLASLRRFIKRESSRFGCGIRSSTSTEEIIVSADKARVHLRVTDGPPVTPISSRRGSSCACELSSKTSKMGSSILERYSL